MDALLRAYPLFFSRFVNGKALVDVQFKVLVTDTSTGQPISRARRKGENDSLEKKRKIDTWLLRGLENVAMLLFISGVRLCDEL